MVLLARFARSSLCSQLAKLLTWLHTSSTRTYIIPLNYFCSLGAVMDSVQKEKRQLSVMQNMQAEVREMGRLAKGGQSFLQSSFQKKKE